MQSGNPNFRIKAATITSCFFETLAKQLLFDVCVCKVTVQKKERGETCLEAQRELHAGENTWLLPAWIV